MVAPVQQEGGTAMEELQTKWIQLQTHVNCLIDSDLDKLSNDATKLQGIRQVGGLRLMLWLLRASMLLSL